jgi:hypothetical protein
MTFFYYIKKLRPSISFLAAPTLAPSSDMVEFAMSARDLLLFTSADG